MLWKWCAGLLDGLDLPASGAEAAKKLMDVSLPSNTMIERWAESEGKPIPPR